MKYSVVIPIHNEEDSILPVYNSLKEVMNGLNEPYEIIFVDDGSTDSSSKRLKSVYANSDNLIIIILKEWVGKSEALQAGFDNGVGEIYITLDGDGQDDPREIPALLNKMKEGYDVVYGWRYRRQDPLLKKTASKIANMVRRLTTREKIHDVGCAMHVFRKKDIERVCLSSGLHRFFSAIMVRLGYRIGEIKVNHCERKAGISKYGIWDRLIEGIIDSYRMSFIDINVIMNHKRQYQLKEILKKK